MPESKNDKFFYGRGRIQTINYSGPKGTTPYTFGLSGYMRQAYPSKKWPWNLGEELLPSEIRVGEKLKFPWEYIYPCSRLVGCNTWFYFLSPGKGKLKKCISAKPVRRSEPRQWRIYPVSPFCRDLWRRHRGPLRLWSSLVWRIIALERYHRESANHRKFPAGIVARNMNFTFEISQG